MSNEIQKIFRENSRLGIPVIIHEECLHGQAAVDGASFPQPIALGATFNARIYCSNFYGQLHTLRQYLYCGQFLQT
ncbi:MAG: hypothetical protein K1X72_14625 [Pyrinomonadaceae bacterium]|nr:hypothetical protein [Pyrinomonadaceae bacterium]